MSLKQIERYVRKARDRVIKGKPAFPDISHLLHHARDLAFQAAPKGVKHLVSVGCAGKWYFDWIEKSYGQLEQHTGVEFYSPKPNDLPANSRWIANTAGHMPEIESQSADGVFSGQNLEHLWPEDVCGFFLESHRILKTGGLLIVDSPNRLLTQQYDWSHPEHTVELTPDEAINLATISGFDVTNVKGLWLCESPNKQKLLPFAEMNRFGVWNLSRRISEAEHHPNHSFLWWIEARRSKRPPDEAQLRSEMRKIWDHAWPERCRRTISIVGKLNKDKDSFESNGKPGVLMYGPYLPLRKGSYSAEFELTLLAGCKPSSITCEVIAGDGSQVLVTHSVPTDQLQIGCANRIPIHFEVGQTTFGVQFRVCLPPDMMVRSKRDVQLRTQGNW